MSAGQSASERTSSSKSGHVCSARPLSISARSGSGASATIDSAGDQRRLTSTPPSGSLSSPYNSGCRSRVSRGSSPKVIVSERVNPCLRAEDLAVRGLPVDAERAELEEEVPVLVRHARLLEVADAGVEDLAVDQRPGVAVVPLHQGPEVVVRGLEEIVAGPEVADGRVDEADVLACALQLVDQPLDGVRPQQVVGVHRQHVAAASQLDPRVAGGARPRVPLEADDLDVLESVDQCERLGVA